MLATIALLVGARLQTAASASNEAFAQLGLGADDVVLISSARQTVRWGDLQGAPRAIFFGFTHCPEVCPTTMADLSGAMERVGTDAQALKVQFITLDPARDEPDILCDYLASFGPQFEGYSGDAAEIARLARAFQVAYERTDTLGGGYTLDHTALVFLVDRRGRVVDLVGYQSPPDRMDAQIRRFLRED
ncbi:MAG: SCO family protein [Hyphomonadaceae bacterium]|nr:SCO family protein [Hyphomonadaceae bacterium]